MICAGEWVVAALVVVTIGWAAMTWHTHLVRPRYDEYAKLRALAEHIAEHPGYGLMPSVYEMAQAAVAYPRWTGGAFHE